MMKKILITILSIFVFFAANAQTKLISPLVRNNASDTGYGTHYDSLGYGGLVTFINITNRDLYPMALRRKGMIAVVQDTLIFQLVGGYDNSNWTPVFLGNTTNNFVTITNILDSITNINNTFTGVDSTTTRLLTGSMVNDSFFIFHNTYLTYLILGQYYTAQTQQVILPSSDPTYDKYVTVWVDVTGHVGYTEGFALIPADIPSVTIDQCPIAIYAIKAGSVAPQGIYNTVVYKENVAPEWVPGGTVTGFNPAYTVDKYAGLVSCRIPAIINNQYFQYVNSTLVSADTLSYLSFYIKLNSALSKQTHLTFSFLNGSSTVSTALTLANGSYGFNSGSAGTYQLVAIKMSDIGFPVNKLFDRIRITLNGSNSNGFQIDNIILQSGGAVLSGSVVIDFAGRSGHVNPKKEDYPWYISYHLMNFDGTRLIGYNSLNIAIDSPQINNGADTLMADKGLYVYQKSISGSRYDTLKRLDFAGIGMSITDSSFTKDGKTVYGKVFNSTGGSGGITTPQLTDSLNGRALILTTTGTSGAATLIGTTLNIPQYSGGSFSGRFMENGYGTLIDSATTNVYKVIADTATTAKLRDAKLNQLTDDVALKANIASPTFTGVPAAPTAAPGTNTTQVATTAFVAAAVTAGAGITSEQTITATASQTAFTFTSVPSTYSDYIIIVNGGVWLSTTGYTTSGNIVTLTSALDAGDVVIFRRIK